MAIHNRKHLKSIRNELRNNSTSAEAVLWKFLQNSQIGGRKFRRQHSIGNYVVDFYCVAEKLAIELDGHHHFTTSGVDKDKEREEYFKSLNIRTIRFENKEVFSNPAGVIQIIASHFKGG